MALLDRAVLEAMSFDELVKYTWDNDFSMDEWGQLADLLQSKAPPSGMSKEDIDAAWNRFLEFRALAETNADMVAFTDKIIHEMQL